MMKNWEYKTVTIDTTGMYLVKAGYLPGGDPNHTDAREPVWEDIDRLGEVGWELVSVFASRDDEATAIFKRPLWE